MAENNLILQMYVAAVERQKLRADLCQMAADLRQAQAEFQPIVEKLKTMQKARMRQHGPSGFVMVNE